MISMYEENIYATIAQDKPHGFFVAMDNAQDNPSSQLYRHNRH
jgi:hypothetical protein